MDVLIGIGSDFDGMLTKNATLSLPRTIIDINLLADEHWFGYPGVIPVTGDARLATEALIAGVSARSSGLADEVSDCMTRVWSRLRSDPKCVDACSFVAAVQDSAAEAIVINDMTIPGYWLGSYYAPQLPRMLQYPVGWGTLGYALPAAVGAGIAGIGPVLAVCGDAGIMFGLGELASLAEEELPVTVLIVDDGGYGMLRFDQEHSGGKTAGMDLKTPDFVGLARSFGLAVNDLGGNVDRTAGAIRTGLESQKPNVIIWRASLYPPRTTSPRWNEPK
jgi:acetolactate synthase-1/2/3 large subunit